MLLFFGVAVTNAVLRCCTSVTFHLVVKFDWPCIEAAPVTAGAAAVAVAGDTVEVRDGRLLVNGAAVDEPFINEPPLYTWGPATVPAGAVLVFGQYAAGRGRGVAPAAPPLSSSVRAARYTHRVIGLHTYPKYRGFAAAEKSLHSPAMRSSARSAVIYTSATSRRSRRCRASRH